MYFMSTECGHPQRGRVVWLMWTRVDRGGGKKPDFLVDVINGWPRNYATNLLLLLLRQLCAENIIILEFCYSKPTIKKVPHYHHIH